MKEYKGKTLNIMLCSTCNEKCKHCYICYNGDFDERTLNEVIDSFKGEKVILNGTEPMLFPKFLKYFKKVNQDYIFTNTKIIMKNPAILDKLKNCGIEKICLSYHFGVQDKLNDIPLSQIEECAKLCKEKGFFVRLNCSLCKDNVHMIEEICQKAFEIGARQIKFTNFIIQGNAKKYGFDKVALNEDEILEALNEINRMRKKYDKSVLEVSRCGSFGNSIQSKHYCCDAGIDYLTITPDLKLYPCIFFAGLKEYEMGFYKDGKFWLTKECVHNCDGCLAKKVCNDRLKDFEFLEDV